MNQKSEIQLKMFNPHSSLLYNAVALRLILT